MPKAINTICSFSLQFPPLAGVDFVRLEDNTVEFRLRVETNRTSATTSVNLETEQVVVTETQLGLILGLIEAHRRAHAPVKLLPRD
jgi:hypothetical protein